MEGLQQQGAQARPGDEGTRPGETEGASPTWLSVSDVQRYLGISRPLVYRLIREGTIVFDSLCLAGLSAAIFRE